MVPSTTVTFGAGGISCDAGHRRPAFAPSNSTAHATPGRAWRCSRGSRCGRVADQLGHADPALTLRTYAHVIPEAETDLSFLTFGAPRRPYTAPSSFGSDERAFAACYKPSESQEETGAPGTIRTCDPRFRKPVLYPTELRGQGGKGYRMRVRVHPSRPRSTVWAIGYERSRSTAAWAVFGGQLRSRPSQAIVRTQ